MTEDIFDILKEPAPHVDIHGNKFWYNNDGKLHRDRGKPAVINTSGLQWYYIDGKFQNE
mgnify:CR=1 FL=1